MILLGDVARKGIINFRTTSWPTSNFPPTGHLPTLCFDPLYEGTKTGQRTVYVVKGMKVETPVRREIEKKNTVFNLHSYLFRDTISPVVGLAT